MQISSLGEILFDHTYIDFVGPISNSTSGHKYIFTAVCDLTKFLVAVPTFDCTALTAAECLLEHVLCRYNFPSRIISDNATSFTSQLIKELTHLFAIKKIFSTPYHPQANIVERAHRTLNAYLRAYTNKNKDTWSELIKYATFAYNNSIHSTTAIECHTKFIVNDIKKDLIPKHHLLLHYPRVIRAMGPPIFTSTMRFEAKHQDLKKIVQKTNNFKNINKTIAEKNQTLMSLHVNRYCDEIEIGSTIDSFENNDDFDLYKSYGLVLKGNKVLIKCLKLNNIVYKPKLLLLHDSLFYEISMILESSDGHFFLCEHSFRVKQLDLFTHSLILEFNERCSRAINMNVLLNKSSYQKMFVRGNARVICETLSQIKLAPNANATLSEIFD